MASVANAAGTKTIGGEMKTHEDALYGALLAHYSSLKPGDVERLNAFEVADARQALKLLGRAVRRRATRRASTCSR